MPRRENRRKHLKLSRISALHYGKLVFRSLLFLTALLLYIVNRIRHSPEPFSGLDQNKTFLTALCAIFSIEMLFRFFPSRNESMGCQKQFACNYMPTGKSPDPDRNRGLAAIALSWLALNGLIALAYYLGWIDRGILFLIALAYSVCDMICILFFCPFQTWMMKNKCCGSCRIYNWDYAMMFTPLAFAGEPAGWILLAMALGLLLSWEIVARRHPERFSESSNAALSCANCQEKLCHHKKQLQTFLKTRQEQLRDRFGL